MVGNCSIVQQRLAAVTPSEPVTASILRQEVATVVVTLLGGTMVFSGLSYTSRHVSLSSLEPATECLLLLKRVGSKYRIAGRYYGAFRIQDGKLAPLTSRQGFASRYHGASSAQVAEEMLAQLRARH